VIYRALLEGFSFQADTDELHFLAEELLSYGLLKEKGIIYRNESVSRNPWGKPSLKNHPGIQYNVSHSGSCAACVISDTHIVGIDVERIRTFSPYAAAKVCSPEELKGIYSNEDANREFFRYWTLKESYVKAVGMGISYPMKCVNFEIGTNGEVISPLPGCSFLLMEDMEGFVTAVCYKNNREGQ
jgi:4'-phosphopantetheinyl transferase